MLNQDFHISCFLPTSAKKNFFFFFQLLISFLNTSQNPSSFIPSCELVYIGRYWLLLRESVMSNQIYFVLFCHFQFTCHTRFLASTRMSNWTLKSQSLVSAIIEFSDMKKKEVKFSLPSFKLLFLFLTFQNSLQFIYVL